MKKNKNITQVKSVVKKILGLRMVRTIKYGIFIGPGEFANARESIWRIIKICYSERYHRNEYWLGRLRLNAHVLDKGFQVKNYESGRSVRYYEEAKNLMELIKASKVSDDPSYKWAKDRIRQYEDKQECPDLDITHSVEKTTCSYDDLRDIIRTRRSIRQFDERIVDGQLLEKIFEVINWSPSSCNRQSAKVFVTNNPEKVRECMKSSVGATCFSDFVPVYISFCADLRAYDMPAEFFNPHIDVSLGIQNCNLVAQALGLSITMLSWASHTKMGEERLRTVLEIPDHCQIVVNAVLGYPESSGPVPIRKSIFRTLKIIK